MLVTSVPAARVAVLLLIALVALPVLLAGCGQRGALYLPGQGPEVQTVVPEPGASSEDEESDNEGGEQ